MSIRNRYVFTVYLFYTVRNIRRYIDERATAQLVMLDWKTDLTAITNRGLTPERPARTELEQFAQVELGGRDDDRDQRSLARSAASLSGRCPGRRPSATRP